MGRSKIDREAAQPGYRRANSGRLHLVQVTSAILRAHAKAEMKSAEQGDDWGLRLDLIPVRR